MALKMLFSRICVFDAKSWKWFFPKRCNFVEVALNMKRIEESLYNSVFNIVYMVLEHFIIPKSGIYEMSAYDHPSTRMEWNWTL